MPSAGPPQRMSTPEKNEPYRQGAPGRTSCAIATPDSASAICSDRPAASDTGAVAPASMNGVIATGCPAAAHAIMHSTISGPRPAGCSG